MPTDPNCIFCKIIAGQIPCLKVYEDEAVLAFLDIGPLVKGHTLVIPKGHYTTLMETPPEVLGAVAERLQKISKAVLGAVGASACNLLGNSGVAAGQSVGHLHFHILPRGVGESFRIPWNPGTMDKAEGAALAATIASAIG